MLKRFFLNQSPIKFPNLHSGDPCTFVGWVSGSVTHAGVGFHASTVRQKLTAEAQPTFILYLIPPTHLLEKFRLIFDHEQLHFNG
ncbi:MAG: hypothetical protein EWV50_03980 [Microcystis aeruginosa Ma_MB_F_20061100_S20]|nr:MAG: hypothetical protein EWV50_03980 [Microcystis aeruginosa Ma_MB_F_20061100_S20]